VSAPCRKPPQAKLVLGLLFRDRDVRRKALEILTERLGPLDFLTEATPFTYTDYYFREMGGELYRQTAAFLRLLPADRLADVKWLTQEVEDRLAVQGKRRINLDPGLLGEERLVLATGKNYTHRIYLKEGIYADLALVFRKGSYRPLPWTYPDYREPRLLQLLGGLRRKLIFQRTGRLPRKSTPLLPGDSEGSIEKGKDGSPATGDP